MSARRRMKHTAIISRQLANRHMNQKSILLFVNIFISYRYLFVLVAWVVSAYFEYNLTLWLSFVLAAWFFYLSVRTAVRMKDRTSPEYYKTLSEVVLSVVFVSTISIYFPVVFHLLNSARFKLKEPFYFDAVKSVSQKGRYKSAVFPWGKGPVSPIVLVYDASDQIRLPSKMRTEKWKRDLGSAYPYFESCDDSNIDKLYADHFYVVRFMCENE